MRGSVFVLCASVALASACAVGEGLSDSGASLLDGGRGGVHTSDASAEGGGTSPGGNGGTAPSGGAGVGGAGSGGLSVGGAADAGGLGGVSSSGGTGDDGGVGAGGDLSAGGGGATGSGGANQAGGTTSSGGTSGIGCSKKSDCTSGYCQATGASSTACGSAAEGNTLTLTCGGDAIITSVQFASYGNSTISSCAGTLGTCHAYVSQSVVESACLGLHSCSILAENAAFGDPCPGTTKTLKVAATCQATSSPQASCAQAPQGYSCTTGANCTSGNCVDGVCCNTSCGGGSTTDAQVCSGRAAGLPGTPATSVNGVCTATICRNVGTSAYVVASGTTPVSPPFPPVQAGDVLVVQFYKAAATNTTAPSDWTFLSGSPATELYWKRWNAGDATTASFGTGASSDKTAFLSVFRDCGDPTATLFTGSGSSTMSAPDATTTGARTTVLRFYHSSDDNDHKGPTDPTGTTTDVVFVSGSTVLQDTTLGQDTSASLTERVGVAAGVAVGTATMNQTANANDSYTSHTVLMSTPPEAAGMPCTAGTDCTSGSCANGVCG